MGSIGNTSRIVELSTIISENTRKIDVHLHKAGIPSPSFDSDLQDIDYAEEIRPARLAVIDATHELNELVIGARGLLSRYGSLQLMKFAVLRFVYRFKIAEKVPLNGDISYEKLSELTAMRPATLRQVLRAAMSYYMFAEKRPGFVSHSSITRLFLEDSALQDCTGWTLEDLLPAFMGITDALQDYPAADDPSKTGYMKGHNCNTPSFWLHLSQDQERTRRFHNCMSKAMAGPEWSMDHLTDNFPWTSVGGGTGTVVDVGGGLGEAATAIARKAPRLKVIVEDRPEAVKDVKAEDGVNVEFMGVDFLAAQPVEGADVYLFRAVLHNWPDSWAVRILRNLSLVLKPGSKILVMDELMPSAETMTLSEEREQRCELPTDPTSSSKQRADMQ